MPDENGDEETTRQDDEQESSSSSLSSDSTTDSSSHASRARALLSAHNLPTTSSLVEYYGAGSSSCGYCKRDHETSDQEAQRQDGRKSYDMLAHQLRADDYCDLLDRGWRRSGRYCYRPINEKTCCPNYSIYCDALKFRLSKSQRKCIQQLNTFLMTGEKNVIRNTTNLTYQDHISGESNILSNRLDNINYSDLTTSSKLRDKRLVKSCERKARLNSTTTEEALKQIREKWTGKQYRQLPLESYLFPKLINQQNIKNSEPKHKLEIKLLLVDSSQSRSLREEEHRIIELYQASVHKEGPDDWTMRRYCRFLVDTPLIVEKLSHFDFQSNEAIDEEAGNFQCLTCLPHMDIDAKHEDLLIKPPALPTKFGTYHCSYHLDGKLIGVGVLDVLPRCITTVYFFYDPEYTFLNMGTYSALIEVSIVRHVHKHYSANCRQDNVLVNYHLGYYVHECQKMHYKPKFKPSYLLCSESFTYVPAEKCIEKLKDRKYAKFADPEIKDKDRSYTLDIRDEESLTHLSRIHYIVPDLPSNNRLVQYLHWLIDNLNMTYMGIMLSCYLTPYFQNVGRHLSARLVLHGGLVHNTMLQRLEEARSEKTNKVGSKKKEAH